MMTPTHARLVDERSRRREDVPPTPIPIRTRILPLQPRRDPCRPRFSARVLVEPATLIRQVTLEWLHTPLGQWDTTVLTAFPASHHEPQAIEVHVLNSERDAF